MQYCYNYCKMLAGKSTAKVEVVLQQGKGSYHCCREVVGFDSKIPCYWRLTGCLTYYYYSVPLLRCTGISVIQFPQPVCGIVKETFIVVSKRHVLRQDKGWLDAGWRLGSGP